MPGGFRPGTVDNFRSKAGSRPGLSTSPARHALGVLPERASGTARSIAAGRLLAATPRGGAAAALSHPPNTLCPVVGWICLRYEEVVFCEGAPTGSPCQSAAFPPVVPSTVLNNSSGCRKLGKERKGVELSGTGLCKCWRCRRSCTLALPC
jgi:hypothetical protein